MRSKKWLLGAGAVLSAALLLTACGQGEKKLMLPRHFHMSTLWIHHLWTTA